MHYAAFAGHAPIVKLLVKLGALVSPAGNDGATGLHVAAFRGHTTAMEMFVSLVVDVTVTHNHGLTAAQLVMHHTAGATS